MSNVHVMDHPLIQHKIGIIRREETREGGVSNGNERGNTWRRFRISI